MSYLGVPHDERRILAFESLGYASLPAFGHGRRLRIGENVLFIFLHTIKDAFCDGLRRALRYVGASAHIGVYRAGQDGA